MKKIFYILLLFGLHKAWCQQVTPGVLNNAGKVTNFGGNNILDPATLTDNVGEPFTAPLKSTFGLTQGFIQPESVALNGFTLTTFVTDLSCNGKNDGKISTAVSTSAFSYKAQYFWLPAGLCPGNDCTGIDSLKAGSYSLTVVFTYVTAANKTQTFSIVADKQLSPVQDLNGPCRLKVFTGITVNNDGQNDHLFIENISEFPNNTVTIFNRWGAQLYQEKGYNNTSKFWPEAGEENKIVPSTYFYVIDPGNGDKPVKGWIEIIKN